MHSKSSYDSFVLGFVVVAGKLRVKDYSMKDPFGVVKTILTPTPLLFEAPSTFRVHPSSKSLYIETPEVNSAIKSTKTCLLIVVLGLYLMLFGLNSDDHFVIHPVALDFQ